MEKKYIKINDEVNKLLQNGLALALFLEEGGRKDLAEFVIAQTSKTAEQRINSSGLREALRRFWDEKKALASNIN